MSVILECTVIGSANTIYASSTNGVVVNTPTNRLSTASSDYTAMTPGAMPIATPVYNAQIHEYQQQQKEGKHGNTPVFDTADPTLAREPMMIRICPNCQQESRTRITTYPTWQTWTAAGVLVFVFWPVCWIPLVLDNCKKTDHYCVLCQARVGQVEAFQDCCVTERS